MKKITLLLVALAAFSLHSNAQTVVWQDDFNDEDISDWSLIDSDGDGNNWGDIFVINDATGTPVTPISLISRSWQTSPLTPDNWAISPAIDLSSASGVITLDWITQVAAASWDQEKYSVHVGTLNDITVLINATTSLTETLGDAGDTGAPTPKTLDISSMAGEPQVYVAFRHWDVTDMDFISIDDVTVTAETILSVNTVADANSISSFFNSSTNELILKSSVLPFNNVVIYSVLGQEVLTKNLSNNNETIHLGNMSAGVYIAKVSIEGRSKTIKFVKH